VCFEYLHKRNTKQEPTLIEMSSVEKAQKTYPVNGVHALDSFTGIFEFVAREEWKNVPKNECAFNRQQVVGQNAICSTPPLIQKMREHLICKHQYSELAAKNMSDVQVIQETMHALNCATESCIFRHASMNEVLGGKVPLNELRNQLFKVDGATTLNGPLFDNSLNGLLYQWTLLDPTFLGLPFQFIDFMSDKNNVLRNLDFKKHLLAGRTCMGVVMNSDVHAPGRGKHWFALFFDFRSLDVDKYIRNAYNGDETSLPCTIEYWNSSGCEPYPEILAYGAHVKHAFKCAFPRVNLWCLSATRGRHQYSPSECGTFAPFYIWKRLQKTPMSHFLHNRIPDGIANMCRFLFWNLSSPIVATERKHKLHDEEEEQKKNEMQSLPM
jgi:hypothetical protein